MAPPVNKKRKTADFTEPVVEHETTVQSVATTPMEIEKEKEAQPSKQLVVATPPKPKVSKEYAPILSGMTRSCVPPKVVQQLTAADIIGHLRPPCERFIDTRYYEIKPNVIRDKISQLMNMVLPVCFNNKSKALSASADSDIAQMVPLIVDACMMALYSKLKTIHQQYGKYSSRYSARASYCKEMELPLPLADAISDIGVFESSCNKKCYVYVPTFPEGVKFEARSSEEWVSHKYESCCEIMSKLGIPLRNVDTRIKIGSAWWTYYISVENEMFSGTMILPPLHYSDNSATIASLFLTTDSKGSSVSLITFKADDITFGKKFRHLRPGTQLKAFMALAQMPSEDWNAGSVDGQT